jgi:hypothetical protein
LSEVRRIYCQHLDRGSADGSQSDLDCFLNSKVFSPNVCSRVRQAHNLSRHWIAASDVRPFMSVAMEARQCQIVEVGFPVMLSGDDMVDLKRKTVVRKRDPAILASLTGPLPNLLNQPPIHERD